MGSGAHGSAATEQAAMRRWNAANGWMLVRTWSVAASQLNTWLTSNPPTGYTDLELRDAGAMVTVVATYGVDSSTGTTLPDPISRVWTLQGTEEEVHLLASARANPLYARDATWPGKIIARVRATKALLESYYHDEDNATGDAFVVDTDYTISNATADEKALAAYYTNLLLSNVDTILESRYVLRKTEVVSSFSTLVVSHLNVLKLHDYARLIVSEPTLPTVLLIDPANITGWYWLKLTPTVEQTSGGRYQLNQEYQGFPVYKAGIYELA